MSAGAWGDDGDLLDEADEHVLTPEEQDAAVAETGIDAERLALRVRVAALEAAQARDKPLADLARSYQRATQQFLIAQNDLHDASEARWRAERDSAADLRARADHADAQARYAASDEQKRQAIGEIVRLGWEDIGGEAGARAAFGARPRAEKKK